MIAVCLAAGWSRRLGALTEHLPKTLLPVDGPTTILELTLRNLRDAAITEVVVVTGHRAEVIDARAPELARAYGLGITTLYNDRYLDWNNCYSLWLARDSFAGGALVVNGDTVHPPSVERVLLASRGPELLLAIDDRKTLGEEEMKVVLGPDGRLRRIHKGVDPADADGEYIGVALIEGGAAAGLADALEATWRRDPSLYYEDGFGAFADRGGEVRATPIGAVDWVEVDDASDLARARAMAHAGEPRVV